MPRIAEIDGIILSINFDDHAPPHFHARYQGESISMEIETGKVIGRMNSRNLNKVELWRKGNLAYLRSKWTQYGGAR
jgi:Domain of unknown function (DUF4160)